MPGLAEMLRSQIKDIETSMGLRMPAEARAAVADYKSLLDLLDAGRMSDAQVQLDRWVEKILAMEP
jgi:hypothetical protein